MIKIAIQVDLLLWSDAILNKIKDRKASKRKFKKHQDAQEMMNLI